MLPLSAGDRHGPSFATTDEGRSTSRPQRSRHRNRDRHPGPRLRPQRCGRGGRAATVGSLDHCDDGGHAGAAGSVEVDPIQTLKRNSATSKILVRTAKSRSGANRARGQASREILGDRQAPTRDPEVEPARLPTRPDAKAQDRGPWPRCHRTNFLRSTASSSHTHRWVHRLTRTQRPRRRGSDSSSKAP